MAPEKRTCSVCSKQINGTPFEFAERAENGERRYGHFTCWLRERGDG